MLAKQIFTNAGLDMLGRANAGETLTISKIVIGDGVADEESDIYPLTVLIHQKAELTITRKTNLGGGKMLLSALVNEWELTGSPFALRELGVMAHVGTGEGTGDVRSSEGPDVSPPIPPEPAPAPEPRVGESTDQLYCASNTLSDPPDTITPGGTVSHAFDITIVIDRATSVEVIIGDPTTVDCQNIPPDATVGPGWYAQRVGNVFQFKRAVAGIGIELVESPDRVTIKQKILENNLDLYVPANHPRIPPAHPEYGFATIMDAHNYLLQFTIPPDRTATINVYVGTFSHTGTASAIQFSHPNSRQIVLKGEPRVEKNITHIHYVNAGNKDLTVDSSSGIITGQRVYVALAHAAWTGGCKVNSIAGNVLHCSSPTRSVKTFTTDFSGPSVGKLRYYPSVLTFTGFGDQNFCMYFPNGIKSIENFCIDGGGTANSCLVVNGGIVKNVHAMQAIRGINGVSEAVQLQGECVMSDCTIGLSAAGVVTAFETTYINACASGIQASPAGFAIGSLSELQTATFVWLTRCGTACVANIGGNLRGGSWFMDTNDFGINSANGSSVVMNLGIGSGVGNQATDLVAQGMSYISWNKQGVTQTLTTSPAPEVTGNQNSFIHVYDTGG